MANVEWRGDAQAIAQRTTLTVANAEVGDVFTITINGKDVAYTLTQDDLDDKSSQTNSEVVHIKLVAAITAYMGDFLEFSEITFTAPLVGTAYPYILAVGPDDGKPFTVTLSTTDAGAYTVTVTTIQAGNAGTNEKQVITLGGSPSGGTYTLTYAGQTTGNLTYDESAADIDTALEALSNIAAGDVAVTGSAGGPWTVEFTANLAATNVPLLTGNGANLTGACSVDVDTTTHGTPGTNELQTVSFTWSSGADTTVNFHSTAYYPAGSSSNYLNVASATVASLTSTLYPILGGTPSLLIGAVTLTSTSLSFTLEYTGALASTDVPLLTIEDAAATTPSVTETTAGSSSATSEVQTVRVIGEPTGGTFTLTFQGEATDAIAYDAADSVVEAALEDNANITAVTVTKSGWVYTVTFADPAGDVDQMTGNGAALTGAAVYVNTSQAAVIAQNEQQRITVNGNPDAGTFTLTWDPGGGDETTGAIDYDETAADLQTLLEALATPTAGDFIVTGAAGGPYDCEFTGTYAETDVNAMTGNGANLTGGGAQTFAQSTTVSPSGPNWASEVENWSSGALPLTDDTVIVDGDSSLLYGLDALTDLSPERIMIQSTFTGDIGLAKHNGSYWEYRPRWFQVGKDGVGASGDIEVVVGIGDGAGSGLMRIDTGDKQTTLNVLRTGTTTDGSVPALCWKGTDTDNTVDIEFGHVGVGYFAGDTTAVAEIRQAFRDSLETDTEVVLGEDVTLATSYWKTGGTLESYCSIPLLENHGGDCELKGSGDIDYLRVTDGTIYSTTTGFLGTRGVITAISKADPAVVTSTAHGLTTGDVVRIAGVVGMTEVNQEEFTVDVLTANTFRLVGEDSTTYNAYISDGTFGKSTTVIIAGEATLDFQRSLTAREVAVAIDVYGDDAGVGDAADRVTTESFESGQLAVRFHNTTRFGGLGGRDKLWDRQ